MLRGAHIYFAQGNRPAILPEWQGSSGHAADSQSLFAKLRSVETRASLISLLIVCIVCCIEVARAQSSVQQPAPPAISAPAGQSPAAPSPAQTNSAELNSHEEATTFKVNVRLVLVRVVARDAQGHAIGNLHKEDFQVFDNREPQVISQFSVEQPGAQVAMESKNSEPSPGEAPTPSDKGKTPDVPERFIAYVFDDVHIQFGDLAQARVAANRYLDTLRPTDRVAIFSTSGQTMQDFTDDPAQLHATLQRLQPRPVTSAGTRCPDVSYYMGDLIQNKHDDRALSVATQDTLNCAFGGDQRFLQQAQTMATAAASQALVNGDTETRLALGVLKDVVRRIAVTPGQRSVVLVSPGFLTPQLEIEYEEVIDRALRSQVIINALDARGLYTVVPGGEASSPEMAGPNAGFVAANKHLYHVADTAANSDVMALLADSTGGTFFQNSNDLDEGFLRVASAPEYYYVLGFSPQKLKLDGTFHGLKVTLKNPEKITLQSRRGYYAPKHLADASEQARQEIEDAVFSQEVMRDIPVGLHVDFFKANDVDAKLTVLAHIDVRQLRFRKVEDRNSDDLTVVSALFDRNGTYLQGKLRTLEMRLKDETLQNKLGSGITLKANFDVKPGSYLVRLVVRDKEGQMMSAQNGAVEIP